MKNVPHYCTHAAEYFLERAGDQQQLPLARSLYLWVTGMLLDAVKFVLPDNGMLFEDQDFDPRMFGLQRLPYPICAFEFQADDSSHVPAEGTILSKRRIALAFDPHALSPDRKWLLDQLCGEEDVVSTLPARCIAVQAVFDSPEMNGWLTSFGVTLTDLDGPPPSTHIEDAMSGAGEWSRQLNRELAKTIFQDRERTKHGIIRRQMGFKAIFDLLDMDFEEGVKCVLIDTNDEFLVVYEALAVLNCRNVSVASEPAPRLLNEKRRKKGKIPFFEYKVLEVGPGTGTGGAGDGTSSHASPRMHLRRGHLRHLSERHGGGVIWINSTIVNPGSKQGVVQKAYKIVP